MQDTSQLTLYIHHRSGNWNGQYGERYTVFDSAGTTLAQGLGKQKSLALQLELTHPQGPLLFKSQLRKTFAYSGKIDVTHPDGSTLAIVTRSRKVLDPNENELLRLQDPSTWKENLAESLVDAIGNALFEGGETSGGSSPRKYLILRGKSPCGSLTREPLPFFPEPPRKPGRLQKLAKKILPKRFGETKPPHAWCLRYSLSQAPELPDSILINAIPLLLELHRWSR